MGKYRLAKLLLGKFSRRELLRWYLPTVSIVVAALLAAALSIVVKETLYRWTIRAWP